MVEEARTEAPATASVTTVDLAPFSARAVRTADVLERLAGVDVLTHGGAGQGSHVRIRGSSAAQVLVLVDGVRANPIAGGGADLDLVPFELLDRVDVVRGAGASRWGADALGGVVFFRTDPARRVAGIAATVGSYGTARVSGSAAVRGPWTTDATVRHEHAADSFRYRDDLRDEGRTRENVGAEIFSASAGTQGSVVGGLFRARLWGTWLSAGSPGLTEQPTPEARRGEERGTVALRWERESGALALAIDAAARAERMFYENPEAVLGGFPVRSASTGHGEGAGVSARLPLGNAVITAGADARVETLDDEDSGRHARAVGGGYGELAAQRGRLTGFAAVRVEAVESTGAAALPSVGFAWEAGGWRARAHAGRAWRIPTFTELYLPDMETAGGNPDLRPEIGWTADASLGATRSIGALALDGDVTAFGTLLQDGIVFAPVSAVRFVPVNTGPAWVAGGEVAAAARWDVVEARLAWTRTESWRESTGDPLPGRPRDRVFARVAARFARVEPFVEAAWSSESYVDSYGNLTVPAGEVLGGGVTVVAPRLGLALTVEGTNLTNSEVRDTRYFPQPGRALWVTARWRGRIAE